MFLELPEELLSNFMSTWLTMVQIARLDSAFCSRESRRSFLQTTYNARVILPYPPVLSHRRCVRNSLSQWVLKRDAAVSGFYVTEVFNNSHQVRRDYLKRHGREIRWVECHAESECLQSSLWDVADFCPNLRSFSTVNCEDQPAFLQIVTKCPLIEDLSTYGHLITPTMVNSLTSQPNQLRTLTLDFDDQDEPVPSALVSNSPRLHSFHAAGFVTADFLSTLTANCAELVTMSLHSVRVERTKQEAIIHNSKSLAHLTFTNCSFHDESDVSAPAALICESMRCLTLEETDIGPATLALLLRSCPGLTSLAATKCYGLEGISDLPLGELCPALRALSVYECDHIIDHILLINISEHCPELRALHVPENRDLEEWGVCDIVERCPHLTQLVIDECNGITDESLLAIAEHCKELTALDVTNCRAITDKGVAAVMAGCPALKNFLVWYDSPKLSRRMIKTVLARYAHGGGFSIQDVL